MDTFPTFYWKQNPHMYLVKLSENVYNLIPPNQCDWNYTIRKITDQMWQVNGFKDDLFEDVVDYEDITYEFVNKKWIRID